MFLIRIGFNLPFGSLHDTCREESSPPCRRVSGTSRLHCGRYHHTGIYLRRASLAFHLSFVLFACFGIRTGPVLAQSMFYCYANPDLRGQTSWDLNPDAVQAFRHTKSLICTGWQRYFRNTFKASPSHKKINFFTHYCALNCLRSL